MVSPERQRLDYPRVRFAALPKLLQREFVVVILVHLIEYLVDPFLRRVFVLRLRLLPLWTKPKHIIVAANTP